MALNLPPLCSPTPVPVTSNISPCRHIASPPLLICKLPSRVDSAVGFIICLSPHSHLAAPLPSSLPPARAIPPSSAPTPSLRSPWYCPIPIHAVRPYSPSRLPPRILADDQTLLCRGDHSPPQTHLHRFGDDIERLCPAVDDHAIPPIDGLPGTLPTLARHPNAAHGIPRNHPRDYPTHSTPVQTQDTTQAVDCTRSNDFGIPRRPRRPSSPSRTLRLSLPPSARRPSMPRSPRTTSRMHGTCRSPLHCARHSLRLLPHPTCATEAAVVSIAHAVFIASPRAATIFCAAPASALDARMHPRTLPPSCPAALVTVHHCAIVPSFGPQRILPATHDYPRSGLPSPTPPSSPRCPHLRASPSTVATALNATTTTALRVTSSPSSPRRLERPVGVQKDHQQLVRDILLIPSGDAHSPNSDAFHYLSTLSFFSLYLRLNILGLPKLQ
ncbi:hypothetical protein B0H13DRAFT_2308013 [Mycena leptocephala]|nr:hypothetical protein B0H13DRAFT_2308013 [Mycena leptocephala]